MTYILRDAMIEYPELGKSGSEKYGQYLKFDVSQLPEIVGWAPGEEYLLVVKVVQKSHSIRKDNSNVEECAEFEVVEVGALKEEYKDNSDEEVKKRLKTQ